MKKEFVKITFQDLEIAEKFFENEAHFNQFLIAVISYYRGKNIQIKTKIVQKFFDSYKKTMDMIIEAKVKGFEGYVKKTENQYNTKHTLKGGLQPPLQANNKLLTINNKEEIINKSFLVFWDLYNKKQGDKIACEKKWNKLKDVEREKIFATLPNFLKNIKDKKFQPLPATYLNQKRWNDELPEIKQTTITQTSNNEW